MRRYKIVAINIIALIVLVYCNPLISSLIEIKSIAYTDGDIIPEKYDLRDDIDITVKNQYQNPICYMVASSSMWETNIKLRKKLYNDYKFYNKTPVFSMITNRGSKKRGWVYTPISIDETEKVIKDYYNDQDYTEDKLLKNTRNFMLNDELNEKLQLLTQELQINVNGKIDGQYVNLDKIKKSISSDGSITYKDKDNNSIDENEVSKIRQGYKKYILENGGIQAEINSTNGFLNNANISDGMYNGTVTSARELCYYTGDRGPDHAVLIIGWDDNFSRDNFPEENRPQKDGAYIVLNSWGKDWGEDGIFYLSYEDSLSEEHLHGLTGVCEYTDVIKPQVEFTVNNDKVKIKCSDPYGTGINEKSLKYMWTNHNLKPDINDKNWKSFENNTELVYDENKYLWVIVDDKAGNQIISNNRHNTDSLYVDVNGLAPSENPTWTNSVTINIIQNDMEEFELNMWSDTVSDEELKKMLTVDESNGYEYILKFNKEGVHTINFAAVNKNDGYEELGTSIIVKLDKTAPTAPNIVVNGTGSGNEYQKGATVTIKPGTDSGSGVSKTEIEILDENGANIEVENKEKFNLDKVGQYTIKAITYDIAGNKSTEAKLTVKIFGDTDGPNITEAVLSNDNWSNQNKTITIQATDNQTGVSGYGISNSKTDVPELWSESNVIEVSQNGTYYVWAKDGNGNTSCFETPIQSKIDKNKPQIGQITVKDNIMTVSGMTDSESGISQISITNKSGEYSWRINTNSTYTTGKLSEGTYYIAVRDKAGNITEQSKQVKNEVILINNIKLSQESLQLNSTINSTKLIATVEPENATNKDLTWRSSNPQIATVDKNGLVTAISDGTVDIIVEATDGSGKSKTIKCTVTEHTNPTKIEIQGKDRIRKGEKSTYTIKYEPENANINKELIWSVNDEEIATINNETGDLEGKSAGEVIITAKLKNIENIIATKKVEVYYEKSTTTKPEVTVTTNSIKLENKQTNEHEKITKIEYGISKDGEIWSWQTEDTFKDLEDNKEYKVKTKVTDENGIKVESEIQTVTTEELIMAKILFKKDNSEEYKVNSWSNSNISYEIIDEKNLTTVKVLNSNNEELKLQGNEITDNGIFAILVETTDGTNTKNEMYTVKIDKGSINIELDNEDNNQVDSRKLKINLRNSVSGIKLVKINGEKVDIDTNSDEFVYEITNNGTYKIEVEDNAGNILEKTVEITNIAEKNYEDPEKNDKNSEQDKDSNKGKNENTSGKPLPKTGERIVIFRIISMIIIAGIIYIVKIARKPKQ